MIFLKGGSSVSFWLSSNLGFPVECFVEDCLLITIKEKYVIKNVTSVVIWKKLQSLSCGVQCISSNNAWEGIKCCYQLSTSYIC